LRNIRIKNATFLNDFCLFVSLKRKLNKYETEGYKMEQKTVMQVFYMTAAEVAEKINDLFGKKIKLEILKECVKVLGSAKVAMAAGTNPSSIRTALHRQSIGDDLSFKVFKGLAAEYPEILKTAIEVAFRKYFPDLEKMLSEELIALINQKIEKLTKE